ncbi:MAG: CotH kinase family protein, partial [Christensenellaceae bacterium]
MKKKRLAIRIVLIVLLIATLVGGIVLFVLYRKLQKGELPADYSVVVVAMCGDVFIGYETTISHFPIFKEVHCPDIYGYEFVSWENGSTKESTIGLAQKGGRRVIARYRDADWQDALPRITIWTEDEEPIETKEYRGSTISLSGCDEPLSPVSAQVRCRGNGSFTLAEKKSYRLKFDEKVSLLGSVARKNYTLIANYFDKTLARNEIAYALSDCLSGIDYTTTHE